MDEATVLAEAERLYHYDAEFHAQVYRAMEVAEFDLHVKTGRRMTETDRSLALHAAAVALVLDRATSAT